MAAKKKAAAEGYLCVVPVYHPNGEDAAGAPYTGPASSVEWLLEQGHIQADPAKADSTDGEG